MPKTKKGSTSPLRMLFQTGHRNAVDKTALAEREGCQDKDETRNSVSEVLVNEQNRILRTPQMPSWVGAHEGDEENEGDGAGEVGEVGVLRRNRGDWGKVNGRMLVAGHSRLVYILLYSHIFRSTYSCPIAFSLMCRYRNILRTSV